ncbi:mucin-2-like [Dromaius novaehollandiae]|uniref:mucin-2-like n=1 Tax=Dromaius novaehollandiae TaxID=8790 RepID=UPI00311FCF0C
MPVPPARGEKSPGRRPPFLSTARPSSPPLPPVRRQSGPRCTAASRHQPVSPPLRSGWFPGVFPRWGRGPGAARPAAAPWGPCLLSAVPGPVGVRRRAPRGRPGDKRAPPDAPPPPGEGDADAAGSGACGGPVMASQAGGLPVPLLLLLLLSLAGRDGLVLGTTGTDKTVKVSPTFSAFSRPTETSVLLPTITSTSTATTPPSSPEVGTSTPEERSSTPPYTFTASTVTTWGSSPTVSKVLTQTERGSTAHSSASLPAGTTMVQVVSSTTGRGTTTDAQSPTTAAVTSTHAEKTASTSLGTSTAPGVSLTRGDASMVPPSTSSLLASTMEGTTLATSTSEETATTSSLRSTSQETSSASPSTTTPPITIEETFTLAGSSTLLEGTITASITSTAVSESTPTATQPETTTGTTPGISTQTSGTALDTMTVPQTSSAGMSTTNVTSVYPSTEPSSLATDLIQSPEVTISTTADKPTTLLVCPSAATNTSASHLFLSLRLTVPLDLENSVAQELILSKLRGDLQTAFPCAGFTVEWRGKRRT